MYLQHAQSALQHKIMFLLCLAVSTRAAISQSMHAHQLLHIVTMVVKAAGNVIEQWPTTGEKVMCGGYIHVQSNCTSIEHCLKAIWSPKAAPSPLCKRVLNSKGSHQGIDVAVLIPKPACSTKPVVMCGSMWCCLCALTSAYCKASGLLEYVYCKTWQGCMRGASNIGITP